MSSCRGFREVFPYCFAAGFLSGAQSLGKYSRSGSCRHGNRAAEAPSSRTPSADLRPARRAFCSNENSLAR